MLQGLLHLDGNRTTSKVELFEQIRATHSGLLTASNSTVRRR
jgi:hypothetical protein